MKCRANPECPFLGRHVGDSGHSGKLRGTVYGSLNANLFAQALQATRKKRVQNSRSASDLNPGGLRLFGGPQLISLHFPLDPHQKIEMHAFGFEPPFEGFT